MAGTNFSWTKAGSYTKVSKKSPRPNTNPSCLLWQDCCVVTHKARFLYDAAAPAQCPGVTRMKVAFNPLMPKDPYNGCTALLISNRCILYIYSTNTDTEYFKHGIYSLVFSLQNAVCFIILTLLVPVLFTFYIQCVLKFKKIILVPKG